MLDNKIIRENPHKIAEQLALQGHEFDVSQFQRLESQRVALQTKTQEHQHERNARSKSIGQAKSRGEDIEPLLAEIGDLGDKLDQAKSDLDHIQNQLNKILFNLPNLTHPDVPVGKDEKDNQEVRQWGEIKHFDFKPKTHDELGTQLGLLDFDASAKITGSRFAVIHKDLARLHRALAQFMLDTHTEEHGYQEVYVPFLVNKDSLFRTGQLPKLADDIFNLEDQYSLIPTGEVPVTNLVYDNILDLEALPLKYTTHTPCFRSEAGSYGKDVKGMFRQHQFEKVELVWITHPDKSYEALEQLTRHAEIILEKLNLPYRTVTLCTGDIGFSAAKTYDIEVWLPGQHSYREISSCSNCEAFQARRLQARFRNPDTSQLELIHTLNGSGLAVGRTLIAVMENYQDSNGNIQIPLALQPYLSGQTLIEA